MRGRHNVGLTGVCVGKTQDFVPPGMVIKMWTLALIPDSSWYNRNDEVMPAGQLGFFIPEEWEPIVDDLIQDEILEEATAPA